MNKLLPVIFLLLLAASCRDEEGLPPACSQRPYTYTLNITPSDSCAANGTVSLNGGGNNYRYRLNEGPFQNNPLFTGLLPGKYRLGIKNGDCVYTDTLIIPAMPQGPLFTNVKNLLALQCNGCHNSANPQAGPDFTKNCVIVLQAQRIMNRAVFGYTNPMPPTGLLSLGQVSPITLWYAAGAKMTD